MGAYDRSCATCANLNKEQKKWNESHYCYLCGCTAKRRNGMVCGWVKNDNELKLQGCSDFTQIESNEQISIFEAYEWKA